MAESRRFMVRLWLLGAVTVAAALAGVVGVLAGHDWSAGAWALAVLVGVLVGLVVATLFLGISVAFRRRGLPVMSSLLEVDRRTRKRVMAALRRGEALADDEEQSLALAEASRLIRVSPFVFCLLPLVLLTQVAIVIDTDDDWVRSIGIAAIVLLGVGIGGQYVWWRRSQRYLATFAPRTPPIDAAPPRHHA
jgi:FtsH-binding integral membrane protein